MRLENYKIYSKNRYFILEFNGYFYTAKDFKKPIFALENNMLKLKNLNTKSIGIFRLYKENLVFSKEYNTIEELKLDYIKYLI